MKPIDRLFVIWRSPASSSRHVIGDLSREADGFAFAYRSALPTDAAFSLLPEFPEPRVAPNAYRGRHLFSTFAQRVPSPARSDHAALMRSWGVERTDDPLEVLAKSGGV